MSRLGVVVGSVMCVGALVGCSSAATEPPGLTASPTLSATPTSTPTPMPTGVIETSDTDLGIVFEDVPDLAGDEAEVYNWVAVYEKEFWRILTTNTVAPTVDMLASPELKATLDALAQSNADDKSVIDGTLHVRVSLIDVQGDSATASVCRDFTAVTVTEDGRLLSPEEAGATQPLRRDMTLLRVPAESRWIVQTSTNAGSC
ncbi:MAG: hypothetical protein HGA44_11975 [Cellulomonadaceae bacterium]|nr:hypothetical protein [Cellulomonadaceae bacterium]